MVASICSPGNSHKLNTSALFSPCFTKSASHNRGIPKAICGLNRREQLSQAHSCVQMVWRGFTKREGFSSGASGWLWACAYTARDRVPAEIQPGVTIKGSESEAECLFVTLHTLQYTHTLQSEHDALDVPGRTGLPARLLQESNRSSALECWQQAQCSPL